MHLQALALALTLAAAPSSGGAAFVMPGTGAFAPSKPASALRASGPYFRGRKLAAGSTEPLGSTMPSHEFVLPGTDEASRHECWRSFDVDPLIAEAVVWPETERYDRLRDFVEATANYGAYITTGGGPDYSIGRYQMKPSFVEELEKAWMRSGLARQYGLWFDTADNATARRIRITRLKKEEWQAVYLGVFLRMLYHSYGSFDRDGQRVQEGLDALPPEEQVRLAAAAYNRGCVWTAPGYGDLGALRKASREKHFHYALVPTRHTRRYCYARLAVKRYRQLLSGRGE